MLSAAAVCLYRTASFWRCGGHGITAAVPQRLHFCDSYERCFFVCALVRGTIWASHPEHSEGQFQLTLPLNFKSIRAVHQRYSSSSSSRGSTPENLATLIYIGTPVLPLSTCDTPGISIQPHPQGEPCIVIRHVSYFFSIFDVQNTR